MRGINPPVFYLALLMLAYAGPVRAAATGADVADRVAINGFTSLRYSITDEEAMWGFGQEGINEDGGFQGTKLGLNLSVDVSDRLDLASQFVSAIDDEGYSTRLDWAFASYRLGESFILRAGKIKFPVGLVNEFVDVGLAYPWISPPQVIYTQAPQGPQATREGYEGASVGWQTSLHGWQLSADVFGGQVNIPAMKVKRMRGVTAEADWRGRFRLQASSYTGEMKAQDPLSMMGRMMDGKDHTAVTVGFELDWRDVVAYAEWADVSMDIENMQGVPVADSESWYGTLGYRFGPLLPHVTRERWRRENGNGHDIVTFGLTYSLFPPVAVKLEHSRIKTDGTGLFVDGTGLHGDPMKLGNPVQPEGDTNMSSIVVDFVF